MTDVQEIKDKLLKGLGSAVNLQIVTYIGELKPGINYSDNGALKLSWPDLHPDDINHVISTQINLVEGDIINIVPPDMDTPEKQWLKDYHLAQVAAGKDLVASNLKMIAEMAEKILKIAE